MSIIASVVMNGGRFNFTTGTAFTKPAAAPSAKPTHSVATISGAPPMFRRVREHRHDDAAKRDERTHGQIDARGDDHERFADGEDAAIR